MEPVTDKPLRVLVIANMFSFDWELLSYQEQRYNFIGRYNSVSEAWSKLKQTRVDIILADTSGEGVLETKWIQKLSVQFTETLLFVLVTSDEMDFVRQAMLAGAHGFLQKPFTLPELSRSIQQVFQLWQQRQTLFAQWSGTTADQAPTPAKKATSIAVFSPKGGAGVTTLAVNLAIALKQLTDAPVLLVDADLQTADVDIFLNIFNKLSILDLIHVEQEVDGELLKQVVKEHPSGIMVLQGNPNLQFLEPSVHPGQLSALIEQLMTLWEGYLVFNTANSLDRPTVEVIDAVDTVLLITTPQLSTLRVMRHFLDLAEVYEDTTDKWHVIMNAYQRQKALHMSDIEESIHYPIKATITQDTTLVSTAINRGQPLLLFDSKSAVAKDILALARQLIETNPYPQ